MRVLRWNGHDADARFLLVRARVPEHLKTGGVHTGRVAVRARGTLRVGKMDGISAKYCQVVQRANGYSYALGKDATSEAALPPSRERGGLRAAMR